MSKKDLTRLYAIKLLIDGKSTIRDAARALNLSERQVKRLKAGVKEYGDAFVIHKNRGKKPAHTTPDWVKEQIIALAKDKYRGANFTHLTELLAENEGIVVSQATVARILTSAGIKSPRKHRAPKPHKSRRRKDQEGLLIQMDASPFRWIANQKWSLHGGIDDATGKITGLYFCEEECLQGYFAVTEQMLKTCGIPVAIYTDRHSIFFSPKNAKLSIEDELLGKQIALTQFARACSELGITLIGARSPQAKGRIERLWETLQDRLVLEMRLAGITTIEEANLFLPAFIDRFNARFGVLAEESTPAYRELGGVKIDNILCQKLERTIDPGSTFSFQGTKYQIIKEGKVLAVRPRSKIKVLVSKKFGVRAELGGSIYSTQEFKEQKKIVPLKEKPLGKSYVPDKNHPWRAGLPIGPCYAKGVARKVLFNSTCARL